MIIVAQLGGVKLASPSNPETKQELGNEQSFILRSGIQIKKMSENGSQDLNNDPIHRLLYFTVREFYGIWLVKKCGKSWFTNHFMNHDSRFVSSLKTTRPSTIHQNCKQLWRGCKNASEAEDHHEKGQGRRSAARLRGGGQSRGGAARGQGRGQGGA